MSTVGLTFSAELIDAARALAPRIRAVREQIDQERRLPRALVDAMTDAGLFHMWVPRKLGGAEVDPGTYVRVVEEVSRVDGSAGWCAMIGAGTAIFSGYLPEPIARDIFTADRKLIAAGQLGASGRATRVDGGYRLSGRWSFASGIMHSSWLASAGIVVDDAERRLRPSEVPEVRLFFFPTKECEIIDTWSVGGLRGTGSNDFAVNDVFVPHARTLSYVDPPTQPGPLYALPLFTLLTPCLTAVALGIARGAIDTLVELAASKVPTGSQQPLRHRALVQFNVARAEARLRAARAFLLETLDSVWRDVVAGRGIPPRQRAELRLAAVHASDSAARAVDLMYTAGGSSSLYTRNPLERAFRDVHAATQHVMVQPSQYEAVGCALLGLEPTVVPPL